MKMNTQINLAYMVNNLKFSVILLLALVFVSFYANAQSFDWQADIAKVNNSGYYKILLSPEIVSRLNTEKGDLRLYDTENKEIPYLFEIEKPYQTNDYFVEYQIIEKKELTSFPYYTRLVIRNKKKSNISNIQLVIRNSDVSKTLKLSGSDDNKNWYSIKDSYRFHSMYSDETSSVIKIIDFPVSNYEYYEILIDDWKNNPLNIIKAGYFDTSIEKGKYSLIVKPQISQLEVKESKQTVVKIDYPEKYRINKITFKIDGPEFYYREAELQIRDSVLNKRNKYEYDFRTVASVVISSNNLNTFYFDDLQAKEIYLRINNLDDAPLKIQGVETEQLNHYLISKLETANNYILKFGDKNLSSGNYDLKYFKDKIPQNTPIINITGIKSLVTSAPSKTGLQLDNKFIWGAILIVALLLIYMISKMLKEMKSQKQS